MTLLTKLSLANKSILILITFCIFLAGIVLVPQLNQEVLPPIALPTISILTAYPGAAANVVETAVTDPLEQGLAGLQGVQSMSSRTADGLSGITLQYNYGTDMNQVTQDVTQRLNSVKNSLPTGIEPQLQSSAFNSLSIMEISVISDGTMEALANDVQQKVVPDLQSIAGVSSVNVSNIPHLVVNVTLDPQKMRTLGISFDQCRTALANNNVQLPTGTLDEQTQIVPVRVGNVYRSPEDLSKIVVGSSRSPRGIQPVKLGDIATVALEPVVNNTIAITNGKPSVTISILKTDAGNTVMIAQSVKQKLAAWKTTLGQNVQFIIIGDEAPLIQSSTDSLVREGLLGALFAILVTLAFLLSIRSTFITAISIPLSILIALIVMKFQNFSLNIITLAGLTIAIGRVIDDSIVVLENIHRHLHLGEEKHTAIVSAVREVAGAVTASTLTTITVFLPIGFAGGLISVYFQSFSITVTVALLASLLVSLSVIPVLSYWFLKVPTSSRQRHDGAVYKPGFLERFYVPMLKWTTRHRVITISTALLLLIGSVALVPFLPTNLLDTANQNQYQVSQFLPAGADQKTVSAAAGKLEDVLATFPEIQSYLISTASGSYRLTGNGEVENDAYITTNPDANQSDFSTHLQQKLRQLVGGGTVYLVGSNTQNDTVQYQIQASNDQDLENAVQQMLRTVSQVQGTANVKSDLAGAVPLIDIQVDPQKAGQYGLSALFINQYISSLYAGIQTTQMTLNGSQIQVDLKLNIHPGNVDELKRLEIPTLTGQPIPLSDVAVVQQTLEPPIIGHVNGNRTATVSAEITSKNFGAVSKDLQQQVGRLNFPPGVKVTQAGAGQQLNEAFNDLYISLGIAIVLVFIVMMATFRNLLQPLVLLVSIPFAAIGSIILMFVTGTTVGLPAMIGLLMLIGIVVTNAIVLLDRINQFRADGYGIAEAVIMGAGQRVRPILMTALATICALLPMAIGLSSSGLFISRPLSIVVIGGLTSSTFLTLLLVPTIYTSVESFKLRPRREKEKEPEKRISEEAAASGVS